MKNKTLQSSLILMLTAFIWGMGFVAQRYGMDLVGPFFFAGARTLCAALTILLTIAVTSAIAKGRRGASDGLGRPAEAKSAAWIVKGGIVCGLMLFLGQGLQQAGIVFTTASKAGFLTALYIVLVPVLGLFFKKHTHWNTWVSIPVAALGLYFLSITEDFTILPGDLILLVGAVMWAGHILVIDHYVPPLTQLGLLRLVTIQFAFCSALSFACSPIIEPLMKANFAAELSFVPVQQLTFGTIAEVLPALLYAGCISAGIGFTLQAVGQRNVSPAAAGLILSLEAVFGAIGGALILGERLSTRELIGCALMFVAVIFAQMPVKGKRVAEDGVASGAEAEAASGAGAEVASGAGAEENIGNAGKGGE
jgi:drug/metabolite transporter (DMT)-like permease